MSTAGSTPQTSSSSAPVRVGPPTAAYLAGRPRRAAPREDALPPRQGLRRRPDAARGQRAGLPRRPDTEEDGWIRNKGLRINGGGHAPPARLAGELPPSRPTAWCARGWTSTRSSPSTRSGNGARLLQGAQRHRPGRTTRSGRVVGVTAKASTRPAAPRARPTYRAPVVVAADGVSSRLALAMGREKREDRPMGVAVRAYYTTPAHRRRLPRDLPRAVGQGPAGKGVLMPGYGWIFRSATAEQRRPRHPRHLQAFGNVDYKDVMRRWVATIARGVEPTTTRR